jgi:hypothetical protein
VNQVFDCPVVRIEKTHGTLQGHFEDVSIFLENNQFDIGGFDFLIAYDASALVPVEVTPGELLQDCAWEYFVYRFGVNGNCGNACPSGLLRIVAMAETSNGSSHPSCYGPPDTDPHELAQMTFMVTNNRTYDCQYVPIYFFWADCADNAFSSVTGDTLIVESMIYDFEGNLIWDETDDDGFPESSRIPFMGVPDYCMAGDKLVPWRCLEFYEGGIDIICSDSIDARGDINMNGVANEVADAVMFANYFISGLGAFGSHVEASIAASDINADGVALSIADLVYLVRVLAGDAPPYAKVIAGDEMTLTSRTSDKACLIEYDAAAPVGAVLLTFAVDGTTGAPSLEEGARRMDVNYGISGNEMRILVYTLGDGSLASGRHRLLSIPVNGSMTLIKAEAAGYYGNPMTVSIRALPDRFEASQNIPNPFNPITTISLRLPNATEWSLTVYNVAGQVVRGFSGYSEAGTVEVTWDATDEGGQKVASGIYLYKATAGVFSITRKMILMK